MPDIDFYGNHVMNRMFTDIEELSDCRMNNPNDQPSNNHLIDDMIGDENHIGLPEPFSMMKPS